MKFRLLSVHDIQLSAGRKAVLANDTATVRRSEEQVCLELTCRGIFLRDVWCTRLIEVAIEGQHICEDRPAVVSLAVPTCTDKKH